MYAECNPTVLFLSKNIVDILGNYLGLKQPHSVAKKFLTGFAHLG